METTLIIFQDIFKTLGQTTRIKIIETLARYPEITPTILRDKLKKLNFYLETSSLDHHLAHLLKAGIVSCRKEEVVPGVFGRFTYYKLNYSYISGMLSDFNLMITPKFKREKDA